MNCSPSQCGVIRNISFPFRLKDDPKECGDLKHELECENNGTTILYLHSQKYRVKAINYDNTTIRLVDDSLQANSACSFPNHSAYPYNFTARYATWNLVYPLPIHVITCSHPLNKTSFLTQTHHCPNSRPTYFKVGHMNSSDVPYMCSVDLIVMTSWNFTDFKNVSLSEIHHSLLYGFELSWYMDPCSKCNGPSYTLCAHLEHTTEVVCVRIPVTLYDVIFVLILGIVFLGVTIPVKIILGFTFLVGLPILAGQEWRVNTYRWEWHPSFAWEINLQVLEMYIVIRSIILFPCFVGFLIYKFRTRHLSVFDAIERYLQSDNKLMPIRYSYSDIKKMTKGFRDKLGQGGYGSVYKGKLRSGHDVAIKLLTKPGANGQDFMNEIATIGRIHHVNVVRLVGYCAERSKHALVYDFMPNGSLEKHIFSRDKVNSLDWETKYKIALGVARGIAYLHRGCDVQILHFDIKPHNILLDDKFIPKISDFGLAKLCSTDKKTVTMTAVRGTIGYVAPELINRGFGGVSYKADVYSFGMLLIEMLGLKGDLRGGDGISTQYFPDWIYGCFDQGKDVEIEKYGDDNDGTKKIGRKMTIVALWCIQMRPDDRPSMNEVVEMLEGDVERLRIPERSTQLPQVTFDVEQGLSTCSTESISLLHHMRDQCP